MKNHFYHLNRCRIVKLIVLFFTISINVHAKDFYISLAGNDKNPGTSEMPFATLAHARDKVREWNKKSGNENITVWLSGGKYVLSETLVFGLDDSAKPGQTITYAALPNETPIICSDVPILGWEKLSKIPKGLSKVAKGKIWVAKVPEQATALKVLFNSKGMLPRARTKAIPNLRTLDKWEGPEDYYTSLSFAKETVSKLFNPSSAEIVIIPVAPWTLNILPVKSVDKATGMVYLASRSTYALAAPRYYMGPDAIWVGNTFAGLDAPGEWVYDKDARLIYLWAPDSEKPEDDIVAPQLIELVKVEGQIDYDAPTDIPVKGIAFKGITFTHGNRFESKGGTGLGLQHDWELFDAPTALLRFRGAEGCSIDQCTFVNSGGAAIRFDLYAQNNKVINCDISQIGGMGILLAGYGPGTKDVNRNNIIANNYIHHVGMIWWHALGIWAWQSGNNRIAHNTIHDVPYTAIAVTGRIHWDATGKGECSRTVRWKEVGDFNGTNSWVERERFLHGRNNYIENNDISHTMTVMQDGNGVYISGAGRGNIVRGNYVHHTLTLAAGEGIRCDDDQHETLIENNIVFMYGTHGIGICSKGCNHIINNIIACPPNRVIRGMLTLEPTSNISNCGSGILHNILYATQPDQPFLYPQGIENAINCIEIDKNIYFNTSDSKIADKYLEWAKKNGAEQNSFNVDPLFKDVSNGDFTLLPNSPAIKLGFRPFKLNAGVDKTLKF